jgi:hypothetical protein
VAKTGSPVGSEMGSLADFGLFFNPLTEVGKATITVVHGITVTFGQRRLPLPALENKKHMPPLNLL